MKCLNSFLCFAVLLAIVPMLGPAPALAGTTTLITYYPAPNGNYSKVTLYPQTQPSGVCRSGAMYVDNTTGAVGYCVDNNINPNNGTIIGGTLAGTGSWGKFQASTPVNFNDVANKGYVDAAVGGGCYVSYSGSCLSGFTNKGSAGWWGVCAYLVAYSYGFYGYQYFFSPPGGGCGYFGSSGFVGETFVCCR